MYVPVTDRFDDAGPDPDDPGYSQAPRFNQALYHDLHEYVSRGVWYYLDDCSADTKELLDYSKWFYAFEVRWTKCIIQIAMKHLAIAMLGHGRYASGRPLEPEWITELKQKAAYRRPR